MTAAVAGLVREGLVLALWLAGCAAPGDVAPVAPTAATAADARARALLAPSGTLRVGVYRGSPSSLVADKAGGQRVGVAYELGTVLASQLAVPVEIVEFERLALVIDALRDAKIDLTGYTDKTGDVEKNLELAKERAKAVREALKAARGSVAGAAHALGIPRTTLSDRIRRYGIR